MIGWTSELVLHPDLFDEPEGAEQPEGIEEGTAIEDEYLVFDFDYLLYFLINE